VPLVVLDPVVLVNTCKVPEGPSAKLLTLLAYGAANAYLNEAANAEARLLQYWASNTPLGLQQGWASQDTAAYINKFAAYRDLVTSIPAKGRTNTWGLALSQTLIDRVVRRVGVLRDKQDVQLDADVVALTVTDHAARWIAEDWSSVPDYTGSGCVDSNVSIHTALRTGAPVVVTKLVDACEPDTPRMYYPIEAHQDYPLGATRAVHFDLLLYAFRQEFEFDAIDATVLERIAPSGPQNPWP